MINGSVANDGMVNGFYAADEEAYQLWLRNATAAVGHIVHLSYNGASEIYPNYVNYTAKLSDFPLAGYREVVKSIPSFARAISDTLSGEVTASIGELAIDNTDAALDQWHNLAFDGQPVRLFQGDPAWLPERFRLLSETIVEAATSVMQDTTTIRLRGLEHAANGPLQTNLIPPSTFAVASSNLPIPKAFGNVFNVTPVVIDEANATYQLNDDTVTAITDVRDDGVSFQANSIGISGVSGNLISTATAHGYYVNTRVRCDTGSFAIYGVAVAWSGTVFCAIAMGTDAATSIDGIAWTTRVMPYGLWANIAWNGSVFCAVTDNGDYACAVSPDGITWVAGTTPSNAKKYIAWNGSIFCIVTEVGEVATSIDGLTWTIGGIASHAYTAICWNGSLLCALYYDDYTAAGAATSPDGIIWTMRTMPSVQRWTGVAWNGLLFCAISKALAGTLFSTSPDGITWTDQTPPTSVQWLNVKWNGTTFLVIGKSYITGSAISAALTSPDGVTWTDRVLPTAAKWSAIGVSGTVFVVVGTDGISATSLDGITWRLSGAALPTPLALYTDYWVSQDGLTTTAFKLAATRGGTVVALTNTATGAPLIGYHWTADLTTGKIYCDSKPSGVLTVDATVGSTTASSIVPTVLAAINVDARSQAAFALTCPQPVGIYVADRQNRLDVAHDLLSGLGAWYGYSRYALLKFGRIEASYTVHDWEIIADQMEDGSFGIERMVPPAKRHRIGYRKNWTDQTGKLVAGVSQEARGLYSTPYSTSPPTLGLDEGPAGQEFHTLAAKPDVIESMLTYGADALAEALRRDAMYYGWGAIVRCTVGRIGSEMDPGQVCKVTHPRFGFAAGVRVPLVAVEDRPTEGLTNLKFFVPLTAYAPGQL